MRPIACAIGLTCRLIAHINHQAVSISWLAFCHCCGYCFNTRAGQSSFALGALQLLGAGSWLSCRHKPVLAHRKAACKLFLQADVLLEALSARQAVPWTFLALVRGGRGGRRGGAGPLTAGVHTET